MARSYSALFSSIVSIGFLASGAGAMSPAGVPGALAQWNSPPRGVKLCLDARDVHLHSASEHNHAGSWGNFTGTVVWLSFDDEAENRFSGFDVMYYVAGKAQTLDRFESLMGIPENAQLFVRSSTAWVRNGADQSPEWRPLDVSHFPAFARWNTRLDGKSSELHRSTSRPALMSPDLASAAGEVDTYSLECFEAEDAWERFGIAPVLGPDLTAAEPTPSAPPVTPTAEGKSDGQ